MSEELRQVRDTLIEELRRSDALTVAGRALFARYSALSTAETGIVPADAVAEAKPGGQPPQPPQAPPRRQDPAEEDEEFGGSFMVRSNSSHPTIPGYRETPTQPDLPRSMRERRR